MAIGNSSNKKQGIGEPMPGQLIEIPYAYVSEYLRAIAVSPLAPNPRIDKRLFGNDDSCETW